MHLGRGCAPGARLAGTGVFRAASRLGCFVRRSSIVRNPGIGGWASRPRIARCGTPSIRTRPIGPTFPGADFANHPRPQFSAKWQGDQAAIDRRSGGSEKVGPCRAGGHLLATTWRTRCARILHYCPAPIEVVYQGLVSTASLRPSGPLPLPRPVSFCWRSPVNPRRICMYYCPVAPGRAPIDAGSGWRG